MLKFLIFLCLGVVTYSILSIYSLVLAIFRYFSYSLEIQYLRRRHVLITGCDTGFGHASALHLVKRGLHVHAGCLTSDGAAKLLQEAEEQATAKKLHVIPLDVTKDYSVANARNTIQEKLPEEGLWAIVNNAGIVAISFADDCTTVADYKDTMEVNFFGYVRIVHAFRSLMRSPEGGRIVFMGSMMSHQGVAHCLPYVASKHAVIRYAQSLRMELGYSKIKISTVCPGSYKTPITSFNNRFERYKKRWTDLPTDVRRLYQIDGELSNELPPSLLKRLEFITNMLGFASEGSNIQDVVDAYAHAVIALYPKLTYWPGEDIIFHRILSVMSEDAQLVCSKLTRKAFGDYLDELDK